MMCPLLTIGYLASRGYETTDEKDCVGDNCAWWNGLMRRCCVRDLDFMADAADKIDCLVTEVERG